LSRHLVKLLHMGYRAITEDKIQAALGLRRGSIPQGTVAKKKKGVKCSFLYHIKSMGTQCVT